jgi:hypothetical protein
MRQRILFGLLRTCTFALLLASLPLSVGGDRPVATTEAMPVAAEVAGAGAGAAEAGVAEAEAEEEGVAAVEVAGVLVAGALVVGVLRAPRCNQHRWHECRSSQRRCHQCRSNQRLGRRRGYLARS